MRSTAQEEGRVEGSEYEGEEMVSKQRLLQTMSSGVDAPDTGAAAAFPGDQLLNAVPPHGSGMDPFLSGQLAEEATLGATDPRSLTSGEPGTPRVSGEKVFASLERDGICLGGLGSRVLQDFLEVLPLRSKTKEGRDGGSLFPLPTSRDILKGLFPDLPDEGLSWLVGVCISLNSLWGCCEFCDKEASLCQRGCLEELVADVKRVLDLTSTIPGFSWKEFFQTRHIDYQGEEVKIAKYFDWDNIRHALPVEIGRVPLSDVCSLGAKHFVDHIDDYIKPRSQWGKVPLHNRE